ncbi:MAG: RHS repeat domain-containing protein [Terriglobales bacterium]
MTVADGSNTETYSYDMLGQITQAQKLINGTTYTVGYEYNLAGELKKLTYPSGRIVEQTYDAIGRMTTIFSGATNYASSFGYNPAGQVTGFNYGNGVTAALGYTPERLLLSSLSYTKTSQTLFSTSYGYSHPNGGKNGQITSVTDSVDAGRSATYSYDALHRISTALTTGSASYPQWGLSWTYDRYGNRTNQTVTAGSAPSNSLAISTSTNRITTAGYIYDANGNLAQEGSASFQYKYDAENRMVTFNTSAATYTYVGAARVKKVAGSTTTVYVFSGTLVIAEYVNAALSKEYVYAGGTLLATYEGATLKYHHPDQLSVRITTDSAGTVLAQQGHYPFGESWYSGAGSTKWQFTSYERDSESGLDYAMFRYHNSRAGRFTAPDLLAGELAEPQSLNRYPYVVNDPVNLIDPLGLVALPCWFDSWNPECWGGGGGEGGGGGWFFGIILIPIEVEPGGRDNFSPGEPKGKPQPDSLISNPEVLRLLYCLWLKSGGIGNQRTERSTWIIKENEKYRRHDWPSSQEPDKERWEGDPPPNTVANAHTHPNTRDPKPSPRGGKGYPGDQDQADKLNIPFYALSRSGIWKAIPKAKDPVQVADYTWWQKLGKVKCD